MALSMPIILKAVSPSSLTGQSNGKVDPSLLATVEPSRTSLVYLMEKHAARGMRALHAKASAAGITLTTTGRGRTYDQQVTLFNQRYQTTPISGTTSIKVWNGTTYYLKLGMAMAAVPGTSNHGWWLADDLAEVVNGQLVSLRSTTVQWLFANAPSFGFYWETTSENWHVHWCAGDTMPKSVLDYEASIAPVPETPAPPVVVTPPPPPVQTPTLEDDEMSITIFECTDAAAKFVGYTAKAPVGGNPIALAVSWVQTEARLAAFKAFGVPTVVVSAADMKNCDLLGPIPHGDWYNWTKVSFASVASQIA